MEYKFENKTVNERSEERNSEISELCKEIMADMAIGRLPTPPYTLTFKEFKERMDLREKKQKQKQENEKVSNTEENINAFEAKEIVVDIKENDSEDEKIIIENKKKLAKHYDFTLFRIVTVKTEAELREEIIAKKAKGRLLIPRFAFSFEEFKEQLDLREEKLKRKHVNEKVLDTKEKENASKDKDIIVDTDSESGDLTIKNTKRSRSIKHVNMKLLHNLSKNCSPLRQRFLLKKISKMPHKDSNIEKHVSCCLKSLQVKKAKNKGDRKLLKIVDLKRKKRGGSNLD